MSNIRASILLTVLAFAVGGGLPVFGQERPNEAEASKAAAAAAKNDDDLRQADVVIDGTTLFSVRGIQAHPAERRAGEIKNRIEAVAGNSKIGANSLKLERHPEGTWIMADGQRILAVLHEDASIEGISPYALAEIYRGRVGEAIEAYRRDRRPGFLFFRALYALGATLVLLVTWRFGRRIVAFLRAGFERRYRARIEGLEATPASPVNNREPVSPRSVADLSQHEMMITGRAYRDHCAVHLQYSRTGWHRSSPRQVLLSLAKQVGTEPTAA